ncbi:MAG: anhydro-N-acetylmuramic acid kinase [Pseudomonadota bacterium]
MPGESEPIWALGLMSGTSMDGIDAAMVRTDGEAIAAFGPSLSLPHGAADRAVLQTALQDWERLRRTESAAARAEVEAAVTASHGAAAYRLMLAAEALPEVIGFHGQTLAHMPEEGWTWQLGDGAAMARGLNRPVVWDFRTADMAAGGEGAPLAPFYHFALARRIGATEPLAFLNIGGVANITWVDPGKEGPEVDGALLAFDTGPGNALLDDWMMRQTGAPMDESGGVAAAGTPHRLLADLNSAGAYAARRPPKSLDRNAFALVLDRIAALSTEDGAATLTALTVETVAAALPHLPAPPSRWLVCGGGRRNATMMRWLDERLEAPVAAVEDVGLDGDMLEAQAFAHLAVRVLRGLPISAPGTTGCPAPTVGGRLSRPS